jgi:hypothetical protein
MTAKFRRKHPFGQSHEVTRIFLFDGSKKLWHHELRCDDKASATGCCSVQKGFATPIIIAIVQIMPIMDAIPQ